MTTMPLLRNSQPSLANREDALRRAFALSMLGAGLLLTLGSMIDTGVLWIAQRQGSPQWEFVATTNTLNALPRLMLGVALLVGAAYAARVSLPSTRLVLMAVVALIGLAGLALGSLVTLDYFELRTSVNAQALPALRSEAVKALGISLLDVVALVPIGLMGMRGSRRGGNRS